MFIFHLDRLPDTALSKQIYTLQVADSLPGLISRNKEHMENLNFETSRNMSKWQFRKLVNEYIRKLNINELMEDAKKYKKVNIEALSDEEFKRKDYFFSLTLGQVRDRFRIDSEMFGDFKGSFPSKFRRRGISMKCELCEKCLEEVEY